MIHLQVPLIAKTHPDVWKERLYSRMIGVTMGCCNHRWDKTVTVTEKITCSRPWNSGLLKKDCSCWLVDWNVWLFFTGLVIFVLVEASDHKKVLYISQIFRIYYKTTLNIRLPMRSRCWKAWGVLYSNRLFEDTQHFQTIRADWLWKTHYKWTQRNSLAQ